MSERMQSKISGPIGAYPSIVPAFFAPTTEMRMALAFGYSPAAWAALTESQRIAVVFAQLDSNLVFIGDAVKAAAFLEAVQYLRFHRPQQSGSNNRTFNYADYANDVAMAFKIIAVSRAGGGSIPGGYTVAEF
jgi:hypothetical protein